MPARTGQDYIRGLQEHPPEAWIGGERVADVTTHPALRNGVGSIAALYDMQYDPDLKEEMTYISPTSGESVGLSFIIPQQPPGRGTPKQHDAALGAGDLRHDGTFA